MSACVADTLSVKPVCDPASFSDFLRATDERSKDPPTHAPVKWRFEPVSAASRFIDRLCIEPNCSIHSYAQEDAVKGVRNP